MAGNRTKGDEEALVLARVESVQELPQVGDPVDNRQDLWGVHHLRHGGRDTIIDLPQP